MYATRNRCNNIMNFIVDYVTVCAYVRRVTRACVSANRRIDSLFPMLSLPIKINGLLNACHSSRTVRCVSDLIVVIARAFKCFARGHGAT